jgi:hypothetical protein
MSLTRYAEAERTDHWRSMKFACCVIHPSTPDPLHAETILARAEKTGLSFLDRSGIIFASMR